MSEEQIKSLKRSNDELTESNIKLRLDYDIGVAKQKELTEEIMSQRATIDDLNQELNKFKAAAKDNLH